MESVASAFSFGIPIMLIKGRIDTVEPSFSLIAVAVVGDDIGRHRANHLVSHVKLFHSRRSLFVSVNPCFETIIECAEQEGHGDKNGEHNSQADEV